MSNKEERMNRNKSIIEDYKNGKPILEIAREYNLSETMCYKILKGTQEPPRYFEKKRKRLTTRNEQIVKQYKGGMTARELGKMYGISMQRIYAILHSSGEYESQKYNHIETALKKEKKMRNQTFLDSGELYEDGKVSLEQTVSEFLESEYTGASRATYVSHYGLSYNTYGDSLSDDTLEIGCSIMTDGIEDFVQRNAGIPCERFSREEFFDIKTECNEFDPIYDECRASDFFWATAAVEFAGIDKMTLKEVLAAV